MHNVHTLFWVGVQGGVYFFLASGGGLRVGTGFDPEGALQDQNKLSQSQKRGGLKKLLKCVYIVNKPPN